MMRFLPLLAATLLAGCANADGQSSDPEVLIRITNTDAAPLQCQLKFGHWVDRDLGVVAANEVSVTVRQQLADGALYVMRDDGQRRMMVENIFCAQKDNWQATVGQMDLAVVRRERPKEVSVSCALPAAGDRVTCAEPKLR
jgi:outer membrane lipoprotein SlyB